MDCKFLVLNLQRQELIDEFEKKLKSYLENGWFVEDHYEMDGSIVFYLTTLIDKKN